MIKFILVIVSIVIIWLVYYSYSNQTNYTNSKVEVESREVPIPEAVIDKEVVDEVKEKLIKKTSISKHTTKAEKQESLENKNTLMEKIDNDSLSELENVEYFPNENRTSHKLMTDEDFEKAESDDLKNQYLDSQMDIVDDAHSLEDIIKR